MTTAAARASFPLADQEPAPEVRAALEARIARAAEFRAPRASRPYPPQVAEAPVRAETDMRTKQEREATLERVRAHIAEMERAEKGEAETPDTRPVVKVAWTCWKCGREPRDRELPTLLEGQRYCRRCAAQLEEIAAEDRAAAPVERPRVAIEEHLAGYGFAGKPKANGGAREGAGRPPGPVTKATPITYRPSREQIEALRAAADAGEGPAPKPARKKHAEATTAPAGSGAGGPPPTPAGSSPAAPSGPAAEDGGVHAPAPVAAAAPAAPLEDEAAIAARLEEAMQKLEAAQPAAQQEEETVTATAAPPKRTRYGPPKSEAPRPGSLMERVVAYAKDGKARVEIAAMTGAKVTVVDAALHTARKRGWLAPATTGRPAKDRLRETKAKAKASKPVAAPKPVAVVTPLEREAAASVALDGETQSETLAQTIARLEKELADAREQTRRECGDLMRLYGTDLETARAERDEARVALANAEARLESTTRERDRLLADLKAGAGELLVPCPEPGTDMARLVGANRLLRRERDEAREELASARVAGQICPPCERTLDEYEGRCSPASRVTVRKGGVEIEIAGVEDVAKLVRLLA